jgi:hypothetical protein
VITKLFRKSFITTYRIAAVISLYGLLIGIGAYAAVMALYSTSRSWIVPVLISPSNDKVLALTAQVVASQQSLTSLMLSTTNLREARAEMGRRRALLEYLLEQLNKAATRQRAANATSGTQLTRLAQQKHADVSATQALLADSDRSARDVDRNLQAGLITRFEALQQQTALAQFRNAYTDAQISEVVLRDSAQQKLSTDLSVVDTMSKAIAIQSELAQLELTIRTGDETIASNLAQIANIQRAIQATRDNPYFVPAQTQRATEFAFVSYDNRSVIAPDAPVYDCVLSFVACRRVGTIGRVFSEEERAVNPIFKTDTRGTFIQLSLTDGEAVKSKTLFVGRKPLLF